MYARYATLHNRAWGGEPARAAMTDALDWNDVRLLLTIARTGSFNTAATALGINQSTVSRRVSVVEDQAGTPLFRRLPSGAVLTPAGTILLEQAQQVEVSMNAFRAVLRDLKAGGHRPVTIKASEGTASYLLSPLLTHQPIGPMAMVQSAIKSIDFPRSRVISDLSPEVADIRVVWTDPDALPQGADSDHVRKLLTVDFMPFCSRGYAEKNASLPDRFDILIDHNLLHIAVYEMFKSESGLASWNALVNDARRPGLTVDWTSAVERPLLSGAGITVLPAYSRMFSNDLIAIDMKAPQMALSIWLVAGDEALRIPEVRQAFDGIGKAFQWVNRELAATNLV